MDQLITPKIIKNLFPLSNVHVKFAFFGAHIDRYRKLGKLKNKQKPLFDLIMAVDDLK